MNISTLLRQQSQRTARQRGAGDRRENDPFGDYFVRLGILRAVAIVATTSLVLSLTITVAVTLAFGIRAASYWAAALATGTLAPLLIGTVHASLLVPLLRDLHVSSTLVQSLAETDPLTNLANRHHFRDRAIAALALGGTGELPIALVLLDIDRFKSINDSFGHLIGDAALQNIGPACARVLRTTDVLARYGGEEFALLLPMSDLASAATIAERVRKSVSAQRIDCGDGRSFQMTVSLGVACREDPTQTLDALIECADKALYHAKRSGRNRVALYRSGAFSLRAPEQTGSFPALCPPPPLLKAI